MGEGWGEGGIKQAFFCIPSPTPGTGDLNQRFLNSMVNKRNEAMRMTLYPPMKLWRVFLLLVSSLTLYCTVLTYRTVKDLNDIGKKKLEPGFLAVGVLIPFVGYFIFYEMAGTISQLAKEKNLAFKLHPAVLTGLMIAAACAPVLMPTFLYPLSISIAAIPWLLLHRQMNSLRMATANDWHQPEDSYTWRQRSVLIVGVPFMIVILAGSKANFQHFSGEKLAAGQTITGRTPIYQLHISGPDWRQVPPGTLYPDTDLELMGKTPDEWVVVRALPNQQKVLDNFVDGRKNVIATSWKNYKVVETRTLDSGAKLTPISLAHYTSGGTVLNSLPSIHVATIVTPEKAIEVVGQQTRKEGGSVQALVESLRLTDSGNKP
ncbi:hypothetical protein MTYM_00327 [Methylococcales bacterium]|nr:hypothetical protein MTYM_00327 [Methylococcales bacterium]